MFRLAASRLRPILGGLRGRELLQGRLSMVPEFLVAVNALTFKLRTVPRTRYPSSRSCLTQ